ncbi:YMGG-like glycine zipper-containing protein [Zavarzinia sp.]|uniref:YMGG-like glycine zipper-containing protein n=1 Tax=Zavarzinia sp. TaxID=2027920 RepID=UPI003561A5E7
MVRRRSRHMVRLGGTLALAAALGLAGCASGGRYGGDPYGGGYYDQSLTPAQSALRSQTDRFNETVGTGAVAGALLGALIGAAADPHHAGRGAAIGAVAGGLVGGASGYYIASQNEQYASREQALDARIQAAQNEAQSYRQIAQSSARVAAENRQRIAELEQQYRRGQISAKDFAARTEVMNEDLQRMDEALSNANDVRQKMGQDAAYAGPQGRSMLGQANADIGRSQAEIARSRDELARALAAVPDA